MPEEHKLRLGDTVEIDGEMWVWEGVRRGIEAKLRRDGTADDWLVVSVPAPVSDGPRLRAASALAPTVGRRSAS